MWTLKVAGGVCGELIQKAPLLVVPWSKPENHASSKSVFSHPSPPLLAGETRWFVKLLRYLASRFQHGHGMGVTGCPARDPFLHLGVGYDQGKE